MKKLITLAALFTMLVTAHTFAQESNNANGHFVPKLNGETVFINTDVMPSWKGAETIAEAQSRDDATTRSFADFFKSKFKSCDTDKEGVAATVYVSFFVSKLGKVSGAKIVNGIGKSCDREVLRIVNEMPDWNPGLQNGKPVNVLYTLPVKI